jgi:O-antigen/teichoic acid export membrane protein
VKFSFLNDLDSHAREILSKSAIAFVLKIIGAGLAFIFQVAVARYLGASGSGVYFLALTIITLVATVGRLGMDNIVTRFVAAHASENDWSKVNGVVRHAVHIALAVSLPVSATLFFLADRLAAAIFRKPELADTLKMMSLIIAPLSVMTLYAVALQGLKRVRDAMLMQSVLTPLLAGIALYYLAPLFGISGAVAAYSIGVMFTLIFGFCMWYRATTAWRKTRPQFSANLLMTNSFPLLWSVLLQQIMLALPLLLLGVWASNEDVGVFNIAQRTSGLVGLVLVAANIIVAPKFAELYQQQDMAALGKVARHGGLLMTIMASPALFLFLVAPKWVMGSFGAEFSKGWLLLVVMALGQLVNVMTGSVGFLLVMTGNERSYLEANIIAAVLCVLLAAVLIPPYSTIGAAIATAVPLAAVNLLRVRYVWQTMGVATMPWMLNDVHIHAGGKRGVPNNAVVSSSALNMDVAFIVGAPRSGTTLLASILSRHSEIAVPPETSFFLRTYAKRFWFNCWNRNDKNKRERMVDLLFTNTRFLDLGLTKDQVLNEFKKYPIGYDFLFRASLQAFATMHGKTRVVEKTPDHIENMDTILKWYPNAKIILIIRDGRDVVGSLMRIAWTHKNMERHAAYWAWCARTAMRFAKQYPDKIFLIRFEDLISEPIKTVQGLCIFLGITFEESMLDICMQVETVPEWEKEWKAASLEKPMNSKLAQWKSHDPGVVAHIQKIMITEMIAFGYPLAQNRPLSAHTMQRITKRWLWSRLGFFLRHSLFKAKQLATPKTVGFRERQLKNAKNR